MSFTGTITTHESGAYHVFEWRIQGFSTLRKTDGAQYWSPTFSFGGERWRLEIYPNGSRAWWSSKHVDLWLCKYPSGRSIKMSVSLSLKTAEGERHKEEHATKDFCDDGDNWVHRFNRLVPRAELTALRSDLLPDDVLTVVCTMKRRSSAGREMCTQTEKNALKQVYAQTEKQEVRQACTQTQKQNFRDASTQTVGERYYNCREKLLMALCIASIIIAIVTGCALAYSKTPLSFSHPGREAVTKIETSEINNTINGSELDDSVSNEIGDSDINQTEGVKKAAEVTLTTELNAELNKTNQSEIAKSVTPETNQADSAETEGVSKIQTSVNNRSDVVESNEFEATGFNETSAIDIKDEGNINKTLAAEMNETDKSEIAASDIPEASATNQADVAEKDESEPLPQPVLMVTEIGSTYLEVAWVLPEESKSNAALTHYIVHFRKYGSQWQVISFPDASGTSYALTNLDPGTSYQIYVMAVDSSGFGRSSETATVRTSNKVIDHNSPKHHEKQLVLYAAAIIIFIIAIACVYHYSKTFLSATNAYGEGTQTISAEDENVIIADRPDVAETDESEESESKKGVAENEGPVSFKSLPEDYGFVTDISHLLREKRGIDVTFEMETVSGETKIFAHQLILAVMSPHFADEFYDKGRNKGHRVIPLKGINPKAFEQMIRYCYGETPTLKTTEKACVLFKIATEYKVRNLQNLCCSFFRHTNINPGDVFCILEISEEMEDSSLKNMCHKILQNKTREVMASYELCDITPSMVHIILDMPSLSLESEYELIKWMFEWGRAKFEDKDSSCRSTRDYLADFLQNLNFLALTVEEFAILSRDYPKVFTSDERASISLNIACPGSWKMPVWYNKNLKCRVYTGSNE